MSDYVIPAKCPHCWAELDHTDGPHWAYYVCDTARVDVTIWHRSDECFQSEITRLRAAISEAIAQLSEPHGPYGCNEADMLYRARFTLEGALEARDV